MRVPANFLDVQGDYNEQNLTDIRAIPCVERAINISSPYKIVKREFKEENAVIEVNGRIIGDRKICIIAGPCAVENREQLLETAHAVKEAGADFLRGGAFKPRSSPYSFQGLGKKGLELLAEARLETGLPVVTEVMDTGDVDLVAE